MRRLVSSAARLTAPSHHGSPPSVADPVPHPLPPPPRTRWRTTTTRTQRYCRSTSTIFAGRFVHRLSQAAPPKSAWRRREARLRRWSAISAGLRLRSVSCAACTGSRTAPPGPATACGPVTGSTSRAATAAAQGGPTAHPTRSTATSPHRVGRSTPLPDMAIKADPPHGVSRRKPQRTSSGSSPSGNSRILRSGDRKYGMVLNVMPAAPIHNVAFAPNTEPEAPPKARRAECRPRKRTGLSRSSDPRADLV